MKKGFFITLEGGEGSGKSTHAMLLAEHLKKNGHTVALTREPGGTDLAEAIRRILLDPRNRIAPLSELLLYEASRAQHMAEVIMPALETGTIVVCDRFTDATLAYQGYGRGIDHAVVRQLNRIATRGRMPDLTVFLDVPAAVGLTKARSLQKESYFDGDRIEQESLSFHNRVVRGYRELARRDPARIKVVRTRTTIEETHLAVADTVERALQQVRGRAKRK